MNVLPWDPLEGPDWPCKKKGVWVFDALTSKNDPADTEWPRPQSVEMANFSKWRFNYSPTIAENNRFSLGEYMAMAWNATSYEENTNCIFHVRLAHLSLTFFATILSNLYVLYT